MPSKPWIKTFARPHTIQRISFLWVFFTTGAKQDKRIHINEMLILPGEGKYDYYMHEDEWLGCLSKLGDYLMERSDKVLEKDFNKITSRYEKVALEVFNKDLSSWSNIKLINWFKKYSKAYAEFAFYSFAPWSIDLVLAPRLFEELGKVDAKQANHWYETICTATIINRMGQQQFDLLKLAIHPDERKFKDHIKKYFWIPIYNLGDKPWEVEDFKKMLDDIENPQEELDEKQAEFIKRLQEYKKTIEEIKPLKYLKHLIEVVHLFTHLRDERVDRWRLVLYYIEPFYRELSKRSNLSLNQVTNLLDDEIISLLEGKKSPEDLQARTKMHAITCRKGEIKIYTEPNEIENLRLKELGGSKLEVSELKGTGAFRGVVQGRARVIKAPAELNDLLQGEILVAHHTSPSYVVAMKRAAAIVTDEGGITSHAAIVSRELKIPCVTATRDGSGMIKTGDLIEVNADRGIVRILKKT